MSVASAPSRAQTSFVSPPPRVALQDPFSEDEPAEYVLHYGFQGDKAACRRQDEAYFNVQRKIVKREDAAHALLLSANVLSMSVMASQLTMYRWRVTEAQTVTEATGQVQEVINGAVRCGYQVRRDRPKPLKLSKYADGEGLKRLYEKNMAKLERRKQRRAAHDDLADADALYDTLLKSSGSDDSDSDNDNDDTANATAADRGGGGPAAKPPNKKQHHHHHHHQRSDSQGSSGSSVCSADLAGPTDGKRKLPPAPPDTVPRLVLVDRFTHETFADIAQNIRFLDERFGLQLVLVLLMPVENDAATMQGAGTVVSPQHDITVEEAYAAGYDLVLRHHFDHIVVNFLSQVFVSSAGRWRGDIRAKAAVGNYLSLKNVLLGRIDTEALQQLVWKESVDDAELLQQLGDHTLALHGEAKRYGVAGQQLNMQAVGVTRGGGGGGGADVLTIETPEDVPLEEVLGGAGGGGGVLGTLPHLRSGQAAATGGVRTANQRAFLPLDGLTITKDELQQCMDPSDRIQHSIKQLRQAGGGSVSGESAYDYLLVDEKDENRALLMTAIEEEMTRLIAENEAKSTAARHLQEDVSRLQRTVDVLRRQRSSGASGGGGSFDGGAGMANGSFDLGAPGRRPDSGSLVNLTKEQQIYVLKERLDQANDQIVALLDGTGRARPNSGSRRPGSTGRGGARSGTGGGGNRGGSRGAGQRRAPLPMHEKAKIQAYQRYHEHREAELMGLQDDDALWKTTRTGDLSAVSLTMQGRPSSPRRVPDAAELAAQRREREATHSVVLQLQQELTQMHARAGTGAGTGTHNESARLIHRMEEALKRLEAQNARIAQLEELRRMDEVFFQAELKRAKQRAEDAVKDAEDAASGGGKKKGRKGKTSTSVPPPTQAAQRRPAGSAARDEDEDADEASGAAAKRDGGVGSARRPPVAKKKKKQEAADGEGMSLQAHAEALEAVKAEHEAELNAITVSMARRQRTREAALRTRLDRLYQHIRQPHTASYARLLEEDRAFAEAHAKDVRHRLDFALDHLKAHQLAPNSSSSGGVLARISDPVAREKIETLAGEYAQHAAQAAEAQRKLEAMRPQLEPDNVLAHVQQLTAQREAAVAAVASAAAVPGGSLDAYLAAVEAKQEVDHQLAQWLDVDVQAALREYAMAAQGATAIGGAPPAVVSVSVAVPPAQGAGPAVGITVSGLELREVAEAYRVAAMDPAATGTSSKRGGSGSGSGSGAKRRKPSPRTGSAEARKQGRKGGRPTSLSSASLRTGSGGGQDDSGRSDSRASSAAGSARVRGAESEFGSPKSTREDREVPHALVDAFTGHGEDVVAAVEAGVASGRVSATQQRWYGLLLDRYERGYIHPDRMIDLDKVATATSALSGQSPHSTPEEHNNNNAHDDDDEEEESETARAKRLYLSVHRELQRLLLTLTAHFPALMPMVAVCTPRVEAGLAEELLRDGARLSPSSSASAPPPACVAPVFMAAADAARLTWVIDYLGTVLSGVHQKAAVVKKQARLSTSEDDAILEMLRAVQAQQSVYHTHPRDPLVATYVSHCAAAAGEYEEGEGGWWASPSQAHDAVNPFNEGEPPAEDLDRVQAYLEAKRAQLGVDPEALGYTSDDLAALFSRKVKDQQELASLLPADLYESLDDESDPAYTDMMRGIRGELEYLNELKQQRMEELVLQYRLRQRQNGEREKHLYTGLDTDAGGDPFAGRAVPEFEVKEGEPVWYGMEAARRVKDILRRKRKPDQIVLDGGPDGGSVGIELSRRTAFPRPPPRDVGIAQSAQDRLKAARTAALPPLKRAGLSHQQQRLAESGYSPRDVSNYNAYQRVLAHAQFDGVSQHTMGELPPELTEQLLQYRASISRAASRLGGGVRVGTGNAWVNQQLGAPYYLPIATADGRLALPRTMPPPPATGSAGAPPTLTTWTYGLPTEQLERLLEVPVDADGRNITTTVVLPHEANSQLARDATTMNARRAGSRQRRPTATFVAGASAYTSPAALAAQRLSTMLHMSMEDPTVTTFARMTSPASGVGGGASSSTAASPAQAPTRYADLSQTRRASRYAEHRRDSQVPPAPLPPPASASAPSSRGEPRHSPTPPPYHPASPRDSPGRR